jgi:5-methylcytosine-specific restriction endonuclease McrA
MSLKLPKLPALWEEEKKRKPIPSKTRRELMTRPAKCKWCRKQPVQEIHHIDGDPHNNRRDNLIPLCGTCHNRVTRGEITKEQLWRRLGIKKKTKKVAKKRNAQRRRPRNPLERLAKQIQGDF